MLPEHSQPFLSPASMAFANLDKVHQLAQQICCSIDDSPSNPWDLDTPEVAIRHKILDQLADFILEMVLKEAGEGILYYGMYKLLTS